MSIFPRKARLDDHLLVDDRTGFTVWASKTTKEELTGYRIERGRNDPRHPQELLRVRGERQEVRDPRAPGTARITGPLTTETTAAASAGVVTLQVTSTVRMQDNDVLRIAMVNGEFFQTSLLAVLSLTSIAITAPLPENVASGALIIDVTANSEVSYP